MTHSDNDIVIGLAMGDEGKGTTVDWLVTQRPTSHVVRFSGASQNAHNVVLPDGTHHTFAQFGSGTLRGVPTLITQHVLVNPFNMAAEADALAAITGRDPFEMTQVSENAPLITPIHQAANQAREIMRGANPHGSCGQGIGETQIYRLTAPGLAPTVGDLRNPDLLAQKLHGYAAWVQHELPTINMPDVAAMLDSYTALMADNRLRIITDTQLYAALHAGYNVFEGSQGVLLDEWHGFHPHTTWSTTTAHNAQQTLKAAGLARGRVTGVTRTYMTRHGAGPFPSEFPVDYDWRDTYPEQHNTWGRWQGGWRTGLLDLALLDYAFTVQPVDQIMITHADVPLHEVIGGYREDSFLTAQWDEDLDHQAKITTKLFNLQHDNLQPWQVTDVHQLGRALTWLSDAPILAYSYGPTAADKTRDGAIG